MRASVQTGDSVRRGEAYTLTMSRRQAEYLDEVVRRDARVGQFLDLSPSDSELEVYRRITELAGQR